MELTIGRQERDGFRRLRADVPNRVVVAFDQLTGDEQQSVLDTIEKIERVGLDTTQLDAQRLGGPTPLYAIRTAPDVIVIIQVEQDGPVEVRDIVQPATLESFAHAG